MTIHASTISLLGGANAIGTDATDSGLARLARQGLPADAVQSLVDSGRLTPAELDRTVLPRKTLAHRRKLGKLTPEQSDRALRVARIISLAEETFGTQPKAGAWLRRPTTALGGDTPLSLLDTDAGVRQVETLIGRIAHGIAA